VCTTDVPCSPPDHPHAFLHRLVNGGGQLDRYLDRLTLTTGVLVIFDRRPEAPPWKERGAFEQATTPSGRQVTALRA
jgi:hypothetical protein